MGILKQTCHSFGEIRIVVNRNQKFLHPLLHFGLFFFINQVSYENPLSSNWMGRHLRRINPLSLVSCIALGAFGRAGQFESLPFRDAASRSGDPVSRGDARLCLSAAAAVRVRILFLNLKRACKVPFLLVVVGVTD